MKLYLSIDTGTLKITDAFVLLERSIMILQILNVKVKVKAVKYGLFSAHIHVLNDTNLDGLRGDSFQCVYFTHSTLEHVLNMYVFA